MDTSELEARLTENDGHWSDLLNKSASLYRTIEWGDPANIDKLIKQIEGDLNWKMTRVERMREVLAELYERKEHLMVDGGVFFDNIVAVEAWSQFDSEELEQMPGFVMPTSREITQLIAEMMPTIVKGVIYGIYEHSQED